MAGNDPAPGQTRETGFALLDRALAWWRERPPPDPWEEELDAAVRHIDATPLCHRCFEPQPPIGWFCHRCGSPVGSYNNWMPYIWIFSLGEVLLSGVGPRARYSMLTIPGYVLVALGEFGPFGLIYLARVFWNMRRLENQPPDTGAGFGSDEVD
jgi:hypothetical protein